MLIRPEEPRDFNAIRDVNDRAFGALGEGKLVDALRRDGYSRLSLVAVADGVVVGHILFSEIAVDTTDGPISALSLAPMAVAPGFQKRGIGSQLVREGLKRCAELGHKIVIVLGHPEYYPRFGFSAALAKALECPYPDVGDAFMALELVAGALTDVRGRVRYSPPFDMVS